MAIPVYRAYLFDLDGTLFDSAPDICGAVSTVLARTERADTSHETLKSYIGRHLTDLFGDLFPEASGEQIEAWILEYRGIYLGRGHENTVMYPGVAETMGRLSGLKGTATTKSSQTATNILTQFGLAHHFQHIQGTDGFPSKPNPEVLYRAIQALGVTPSECLFVGDSVPDMIAGKAAGVSVCAVAYGYGSENELRACEPDYWLERFSDLV
jgi:HAD superfamily hydrolase (TIGR01509 family)